MAKKIILEDTFATELKRCRVRLRMTQLKLSIMAGIPLSNIKAWEQGKQMPNYDNWEKLYKFFEPHHITRNLEIAYTREKGQ